MPFQKIRNIGLAAHIDAGKTTVTERMLFFSGKKHKLGEVHDGEATMDFMEQEKERGITIGSAAISCEWNDHQVNIIDTPGHIDFTVEVERSLRVIDGLVAIFCAVEGVEPQSEVVWSQADRYKIPRIAFINKMDRKGADFYEAVRQMDDYLDANPVPFEVPIGAGKDFAGTICPIERKAIFYEGFERVVKDVPPEYQEECEEARKKIIETLADFNDELMKLYLDEEPIPTQLLKKVAREASLHLLITPVFCGSAYKNKGIRVLLDAVADYLPSPIDAGAVFGDDLENPDKTHKREPSIHSPFCGLAFKVMHDPYVGQQTFMRIYSGEIEPGMKIYNPIKEKKERIGRILKIHADDREELEKAGPGDIVALIGMKTTTTGDTLCDAESPLRLEQIYVPPSVVKLKVSAQSNEDENKLGKALRKISMEDPSFNYEIDGNTSETVISGMGELHLDIILDRIKRDFGVKAEVGEPSVAFKETITQEARSEVKFVKQSGGKGQYAHCVMRLEPNFGEGFEFVDHIRGGRIPTEFIPSVEKGVKEAMEEGILGEFPVVDLKVVLIDGSSHEVDSSGQAFQQCGKLCFTKAFKKGGPVLLEPVMEVDVNFPEDYVGDLIKDINQRRGDVKTMNQVRKGTQHIKFSAPLMEMFGYATQLRNLSRGRANYSMEFKEYAPLKQEMTEKVLKEIKEDDDQGEAA